MNGLLSSLILFGSFEMRTPNDITIPKDDYEVSIGFKNDKVYFKRDWERELGSIISMMRFGMNINLKTFTSNLST